MRQGGWFGQFDAGMNSPGGPVVPSSFAEYMASLEPVAWWRLGETSGTVAADEMGAYPGTYVGALTLGAAGAILGDADSAVTFDGSDHAVTSAMPIINDAPAWTVAVWIKTTAAGIANGRAIYCERSASGLDILKLGCSLTGGGIPAANNAVVTLRNDAGTLLQMRGTFTINDGLWHLIVAVRDGSAVRLYVDGRLDTSGVFSGSGFTDAGRETWLGQDKGDGAGNYVGSIDEAAVWRRALSEDEIAVMFAWGSRGTSVVPRVTGVYFNGHNADGTFSVRWEFSEPVEDFTGGAEQLQLSGIGALAIDGWEDNFLYAIYDDDGGTWVPDGVPLDWSVSGYSDGMFVFGDGAGNVLFPPYSGETAP